MTSCAGHDESSERIDWLGGVELRTARPEDGPDIAWLIRASKLDAMPWLAIPHTLDEDEMWVARILLPKHTVTVAELHGELVGVLATSPGWVDQLYVRPSEQGRGIGSALLRLAMEAMPASLELWTFRRNERARRFYERHGFTAIRRTNGDNEEREPDVLYSWPAASHSDA